MSLIDHPTNDLSANVIGAAIEVHRKMGPGLLESAYHWSLAQELEIRGIPFKADEPITAEYKGRTHPCAYRLDFLVDDRLVVELKAVGRLVPVHEAQVLTYLRLLGLQAGLLINFNVRVLRLGIRRLLL